MLSLIKTSKTSSDGAPFAAASLAVGGTRGFSTWQQFVSSHGSDSLLQRCIADQFSICLMDMDAVQRSSTRIDHAKPPRAMKSKAPLPSVEKMVQPSPKPVRVCFPRTEHFLPGWWTERTGMVVSRVLQKLPTAVDSLILAADGFQGAVGQCAGGPPLPLELLLQKRSGRGIHCGLRC